MKNQTLRPVFLTLTVAAMVLFGCKKDDNNPGGGNGGGGNGGGTTLLDTVLIVTAPFNGPFVEGSRVICEASGRNGQYTLEIPDFTFDYTIPENCTSYAGIATTDTAFVQEEFAGGCAATIDFRETTSRNFDFQLGGAALSNYRNFQIYFQSRSSGFNTVTRELRFEYSLDGTTYSNVGTTEFRNGSAWQSFRFDLPEGANNPSGNLYFRVVAPTGSNPSEMGNLRFDNIQIRGARPQAS